MVCFIMTRVKTVLVVRPHLPKPHCVVIPGCREHDARVWHSYPLLAAHAPWGVDQRDS